LFTYNLSIKVKTAINPSGQRWTFSSTGTKLLSLTGLFSLYSYPSFWFQTN